MPTRPPRHQPILGDPRIARREREQRRGNSADRGYDHHWRAFRAAFLAEHPLCLDCLACGRATPASEPHHIRKVRSHPELMYDPANCRALCHDCHAIRTGRGE